MNSPIPSSNSKWIAASEFGGPRTTEPARYFRKVFRLDQPVRRADFQIAGLGVYEVEINGRAINDHVLSPGWTDYGKTIPFESHGVGSFLHAGENVLGVILGAGWYCGFVAWRNRQIYGDRPRLRAELKVTFADGSCQEILTDESWQTRTGPILENDLLMGEAYDARRELGEWSAPGHDASAWSNVIISSPEGSAVLRPRSGPPIRRMQEIPPVSVRVFPCWTGPIRVVDFGQNFAGRVRIRVKAQRGRTVRLRHAEMLKPDGSLYTANLRAARAEDSYVCKGGDVEEWEPRFTFHGFRYVEVTGLLDADEIDLVGVVVYSDMATTGEFSCSNPLLNRLQSNIVWSQKSNFLDVPTDCPQRDERLGWTGDAQIFVRTACFNMDVREFFRKWMRDIRDAQQPDGGIPCVVPHLDIHTLADNDGGPAWSDAAIICPWTIYSCYGDREILEENYPAMTRYLDFLVEHRSIDLIRSHPDIKAWRGYGDWLALDGSDSDLGGTPLDLIGTAFLAYVASIMTRIADVLGESEDAGKYRKLHASVVESFRKRFVTAHGELTLETQTAAVLALHFDLMADEHRRPLAQRLVERIRKNDWHLGTGFVGTAYLLDVLEESGFLEDAYRLLEQTSFPSWLFPVTNGATTIWERWDAWTPDKGFHGEGMNSFNHYAFGAVGAWMYRTVAGIDLDPDCAGYAKIRFKPRPGGSLKWAQASLRTAQGMAGLRWDKVKNSLGITLTVPPECRGSLILPEGYSLISGRTEFGPGNHLIEARCGNTAGSETAFRPEKAEAAL